MPLKKPGDYAADPQYFLNDGHFRAALYLASPVFFASLERQHFQAGNLTEREENTLWKYINHCCFRPTPFGLFSSVSLISWDENTALDMQDSDFKVTAGPDQSFVMMMGRELLLGELGPASLYIPNFTLYRSANEYRFIRTAIEQTSNKREYLLLSTAFLKLLKDLILYSSAGKNKVEIIAFIEKEWLCSYEEGAEYFDFLTDAQLLINTLNPNITGQDYLQRLLQEVSAKGISNFRTLQLNKIFRLLDTPKIEQVFFEKIRQSLQKSLSVSTEDHHSHQDQVSVILRREFRGGLDSKYQNQINDGLFALDCLSPRETVPNLDVFVKAFQKDFEGQTLPLLAALDPETGIGYQEILSDTGNQLLETVNIQADTNRQTRVNWTAAHSYLLDCWQKIRDGAVPVIQLSRQEINWSE